VNETLQLTLADTLPRRTNANINFSNSLDETELYGQRPVSFPEG